jgi:hypothetical protein
MTPIDEVGFERELGAAMAQEVAHLPAPRTDLGAIRRRTATRRRVLVPAVVGLVSLVIAGPFALAQSDLRLPKLPGAVQRGPTTAPAQHGQAPPAGEAPTGSQPARPAPASGQAGGQPPVSATSCVTARGPLPAAERAALLRAAATVLDDTQAAVAGALGEIERLSVATGTADRLLPRVGSVVRLVTCGDQVRLAPAERLAILGRVRSAVQAAAVVAAGVVRETVGESELDVVTPVAVTVVNASPTAVWLGVALGGGPVPDLGTVTVTVRPLDGKVAEVDLSGLDLRELEGGILGSLPGLDLLGSLDLVDGLAGLDGLDGVTALVPSATGVLAEGVTIVPPVGR